MNFLQFFVWGAWLISLGGYMIVTLAFFRRAGWKYLCHYGTCFSFYAGAFGDCCRQMDERRKTFWSLSHWGALLLLWASYVTDYDVLYVIMLLNAMVYMPTIALNNSVSYDILMQRNFDVVKDFPPIRVWGTIGFIAAMWLVDLFGWTKSPLQLQISAVSALFLGLYAFTMPACRPLKVDKKEKFGFFARTGCLCLIQAKKDARVFYFFNVTGSCVTNNQCIWWRFFG